MTPEVAQAVEEIRSAFAGHTLAVDEEPQGGAYVVVSDLPIGASFTPSTSWVGFLITFQYPRADVYPHLIDSSIKRADRAAFGQGLSGPVNWRDRKALQVSRRSNHLNPTIDTAATKLLKVLAWLQAQ
jgi:hypothetical protein